MRLLIVDGDGEVVQEYGDVTAQIDGVELQAVPGDPDSAPDVIMARIPGDPEQARRVAGYDDGYQGRSPAARLDRGHNPAERIAYMNSWIAGRNAAHPEDEGPAVALDAPYVLKLLLDGKRPTSACRPSTRGDHGRPAA
jgi:hypothetical protein